MMRGLGKKLLELPEITQITQCYFFRVTFPIQNITPPAAPSWWWFWNTAERGHHGPV